MALDAASYPILWKIFDETGIRPEYLLPTLWSESGLRPGIQNLGGADYYGINQASGSYLRSRGIDPQQYLSWPASQQLDVVVRAMAHGWPLPLLSGTRVRQANFIPATVNGAAGWRAARAPGDVIVASPHPYYAANCGMDLTPGSVRCAGQNRSGAIRVSDLMKATAQAASAVRNNISLAYVSRAGESPCDPVVGDDPYLGGGSGILPTSKLGVAAAAAAIVAVGAAVAYALTERRRRRWR